MATAIQEEVSHAKSCLDVLVACGAFLILLTVSSWAIREIKQLPACIVKLLQCTYEFERTLERLQKHSTTLHISRPSFKFPQASFTLTRVLFL